MRYSYAMSLKIAKPMSSRIFQRGLGLIAAIFVITLMSLIIVGISSLVVTSKESYGYEILSARAFHMADSGSELALSRLLFEGTDSCNGEPRQFPPPELQVCSVVVICHSVTIAEVDYFTVQSTGTCGNGIDQAVRQSTLRVQR
ncbi:MAG: MSHA biogenesis protein MshP [Motiliproteus sp.]|jgi:MSHA biogenesis protein MshP